MNAVRRLARRGLLAAACGASVLGCASFAVKTEGVAGPVSWQATDLDLSRRTSGTQDLWTYSFFVLLHEQQGTSLVFNEIRTAVYQPRVDTWATTYNGVWRLGANGLMRIPLQVTLYCPSTGGGNCAGPSVPAPLWQLGLRGRDEQKRPISIVIDIRLPADPATVPSVTSKSTPAIELVRPAPPARSQ